GFRDTALGGAVLLVIAALGFTLLPYPGPIWAVVLDQVILGAGFGLLSTPLLVGVQTVVTWERRGVVTGANMFSLYLGQSLGAATFGAIFNATMAARLRDAPAALRDQLPHDINAVINALYGRSLSDAAEQYLRHALFAATHHIYLGVLA